MSWRKNLCDRTQQPLTDSKIASCGPVGVCSHATGEEQVRVPRCLDAGCG